MVISNPFIISIYLLNVFDALTGSANIGDIIFEDDDNFDVESQTFHKTPDVDNSDLFNRGECGVSSGSSDSSESSERPSLSSIIEMEIAFVAMYENYKVKRRWELMDNKDPTLWSKICAKAWVNPSHNICEGKPRPHLNKPGNCLGVVVKVKQNQKIVEKKIRADFLQCKCWPSSMSNPEGRLKVSPICLARFNDTHVFVLLGPKGSRKLRVHSIKDISNLS